MSYSFATNANKMKYLTRNFAKMNAFKKKLPYKSKGLYKYTFQVVNLFDSSVALPLTKSAQKKLYLATLTTSNISITRLNALSSQKPIQLLHGAMAQWLRRWISNPGVPCSKPLGGSKVDSAFHSSEVDKMSTRNFLELSGKK